jgi:hypothetical protein
MEEQRSSSHSTGYASYLFVSNVLQHLCIGTLCHSLSQLDKVVLSLSYFVFAPISLSRVELLPNRQWHI